MIKRVLGRAADYTMKKEQMLINPKDRFPRFESLFKSLKAFKDQREIIIHRFENEKAEMVKNGLSE